MPAAQSLPQAPLVLESLLNLAKAHGEDSEPDHEVGDLQDLLRAVWPLLTAEQICTLMQSEAISALVETKSEATPIGDTADLDKSELGEICAHFEIDESILTDEEKIALVNQARIINAAESTGSPPDVEDAQYLVGTWTHLFGPGKGRDTLTRIVFDRDDNAVVAMQVHRRGDLGFSPSTSDERADVTDSIVNANPEALESPDDYGLEPSDEVPGWAVDLMHSAVAPRDRG